MNKIEKIKKFLLDTLFPVTCISCGRENEWLCGDCIRHINLRRDQVCPLCEKSFTPDGRVCFFCRRKSALDGLLVATSYQNEVVSSAIHYFKYRFVEGFSRPLGKIIAGIILNSQLPIPDLIIPVPLHSRRLRYRGFNQAGLLARYISSRITPGFPVPVRNNILSRAKHSVPQMEIKNYQQRKKNIEGLFKIHPVKSAKGGAKQFNRVKGKTVLLVDDIATTGATLFECARVLKENGAKEVFAAVIARQEFKKK